jgi:hypothetical protein
MNTEVNSADTNEQDEKCRDRYQINTYRERGMDSCEKASCCEHGSWAAISQSITRAGKISKIDGRHGSLGPEAAILDLRRSTRTAAPAKRRLRLFPTAHGCDRIVMGQTCAV